MSNFASERRMGERGKLRSSRSRSPVRGRRSSRRRQDQRSRSPADEERTWRDFRDRSPQRREDARRSNREDIHSRFRPRQQRNGNESSGVERRGRPRSSTVQSDARNDDTRQNHWPSTPPAQKSLDEEFVDPSVFGPTSPRSRKLIAAGIRHQKLTAAEEARQRDQAEFRHNHGIVLEVSMFGSGGPTINESDQGIPTQPAPDLHATRSHDHVPPELERQPRPSPIFSWDDIDDKDDVSNCFISVYAWHGDGNLVAHRNHMCEELFSADTDTLEIVAKLQAKAMEANYSKEFPAYEGWSRDRQTNKGRIFRGILVQILLADVLRNANYYPAGHQARAEHRKGPLIAKLYDCFVVATEENGYWVLQTTSREGKGVDGLPHHLRKRFMKVLNRFDPREPDALYPEIRNLFRNYKDGTVLDLYRLHFVTYEFPMRPRDEVTAESLIAAGIAREVVTREMHADLASLGAASLLQNPPLLPEDLPYTQQRNLSDLDELRMRTEHNNRLAHLHATQRFAQAHGFNAGIPAAATAPTPSTDNGRPIDSSAVSAYHSAGRQAGNGTRSSLSSVRNNFRDDDKVGTVGTAIQSQNPLARFQLDKLHYRAETSILQASKDSSFPGKSVNEVVSTLSSFVKTRDPALLRKLQPSDTALLHAPSGPRSSRERMPPPSPVPHRRQIEGRVAHVNGARIMHDQPRSLDTGTSMLS